MESRSFFTHVEVGCLFFVKRCEKEREGKSGVIANRMCIDGFTYNHPPEYLEYEIGPSPMGSLSKKYWTLRIFMI